MDSPAPTAPFGAKALLPLAAVVQEDLRLALRHWAILAWAAAALIWPAWHFMALPSRAAAAASVPVRTEYDESGKPYVAAAPVVERRAEDWTAARYGAYFINLHLLWGACLAMAFGATAIAGEVHVAGDAVLCWGVARWQYFVGKCLARALAAMLLFLATAAPMLWLFSLRAEEDVTLWGAVRALSAAATAIGALAALAAALGAWFRSAAPAVGAAVAAFFAFRLLAAWLCGAGSEWSPATLAAALGPALRGVDFANPLPKLLCCAAACWAGVSAVRFRFADL